MRFTSGVVALLVLALFAPVLVHQRPRNPPVEREHAIETAMKVPAGVQGILRRSCYDCHSYETRWPWYSAVTPVSGRMEQDVRRARAVMNFSEWAITAGASPARAAATLNAACAAVQTGVMPKPGYRLIHPEARLSPAEVDAFCEWVHSQASELAASARARRARTQLTNNLRSSNNRSGSSALP